MIGTHTDISAQRAAEEEGRLANERLRLAVFSSGMIWWEWKIVGGDFGINAFGQPCILGYAPEQLAGINAAKWLELTHPDECAAVAKTLEDALAGRSDTWRSEHRLLDAAGRWRWVRHIGRVSKRAADGSPLLMVGTTQDVQDRHETELLAGVTAHRLQIALDASRMGVWGHNFRTLETDWDERCLEIYGITREQIPRDDPEFFRLILQEDLPAVLAMWDKLRAGEKRFEYLYRIRRRDGAVRHIRTAGIMEHDAHGRPRSVTGIDEDITDRVEADNKRRHLEEQLIQSQKIETLGTLAGEIAHDFNNLLTGVLGFTELPTQSLPANHQAVTLLQHARDGGLRARDLVKRLLLFARQAPGTGRQPVQIERVVTDMLPLLGRRCRRR